MGRPTTIQGVGDILFAVGIRNMPLTVKTKNETKSKIVLLGVLHILWLFTYLVSRSQFFQKGFYLHDGNQTINFLFSNTKIASAPIQDRLFVLKTHKGTEKLLHTSFAQAATTTTDYSTALIQTWHRRPEHPSYSHLKRFVNLRGINMPKLKLKKTCYCAVFVLTRLLSDYSVCIRNSRTDKVVIVVVYIDEFLLFDFDMKKMESAKWWLAAHYKMKDIGSCGQFLGVKIEQDDRLYTISLSQKPYIDKALTTSDMDNCKRASSLMMANPNFIKNTKAAEDKHISHNWEHRFGHMYSLALT